KSTICVFRALDENKENNIQFVVDFFVPLDPILDEDWYLYTFQSYYLNLLTIDQARELILLVRTNQNDPLETNEQVIQTALHYGGRHPEFLEHVSLNIQDNGDIEKGNINTWL